METKKLNNQNNFKKFVELQKEVIDSSQNGTNIYSSILHLEELFRFFNEHFHEFREKENSRVILTFVHRCLKVWICGGDYLKDDIGRLLVNLIGYHREDDADINIALQIVYQVMHSIKFLGNENVDISEKLLCELIELIPSIKTRATASNCIACIHKYVEMFPESFINLGPLWSHLKSQIENNLKCGVANEVHIDILVQCIDDFKLLESKFYKEPTLVSIVQHLLKSDQRKFRKCGYYLLKKLFYNFIECGASAVERRQSSDNIERSCIMYVTILENLEEEQSHLILPSLQNLEELVKSDHLMSTWLNILYVRILTHNNNLVLRWSIEFFLGKLSCSDLCEETLKHLLQATNSNSFFNYEGYFLETAYFSTFLKGDVTILLRLFSVIENWKSVPLFIWLTQINKIDLPKSLTFEDVLKISSCVRKLQNCDIREKAVNECNKLFKEFIKNMCMKEYVTYIETLYNPSDKYVDHEVFFSKKSSLILSKPDDCIYKQRFYEIFTNCKWNNVFLLSFLKEVPVEKHGWLKFALFHYKLEESDRNLISNLYKLDLNEVKCLDIDEIVNMFKNRLIDSLPYDKHELIECNKAAISFFIYQTDILKIEDEDTLSFILITGMRHNNVIDAFAQKLLNPIDNKVDLWIIDELLKYNSQQMLNCISSYLSRAYEENVVKKYAIIILKKCNFELNNFEYLNLFDHFKDEWFEELASQGDKRIEESFSFNRFGSTYSSLAGYCIRQIQTQDEQIVLDLLKYHIDITKKKPRYFENSNEHRVKLRIAICVYKSTSKGTTENVLDKIWNILLNENNQLNITHIYEYILGKTELAEGHIINKLKEALNLTSSQQVSIISVAYTYFQTHPSTVGMQNEMTNALLSLTMGPNFQTRTLAQMSLYKLLMNKFERTESSKQIIRSIQDALGAKLDEYLHDIRLHIPREFCKLETILYITNAPFDELLNGVDWAASSKLERLKSELHEIECCRKRYLNKFKVTKNYDSTLMGTVNHQVQRKINPVSDLTEPHNLLVYPIEENSTAMIVVASLIDKLPNLGGIARTCEVLGIKNLVMDSKMHTQKNDFKNLSMTAEKTLNILEVKPKDLEEFLILKKIEGYSIVGAEQTCNSQNFENFKFPQKCILLLGHEKDGIPAPLLGLLDDAVEIPQFGQVRSLNVHVTGALFIWEYCKQHLIRK